MDVEDMNLEEKMRQMFDVIDRQEAKESFIDGLEHAFSENNLYVKYNEYPNETAQFAFLHGMDIIPTKIMPIDELLYTGVMFNIIASEDDGFATQVLSAASSDCLGKELAEAFEFIHETVRTNPPIEITDDNILQFPRRYT